MIEGFTYRRDGITQATLSRMTCSRYFSPLNKILRGEKLSNIVKGITLKAKNESYYLLKMIEAGNKKDKTEHDNTLRYLLDFAYEGITEYTKTI